MDRLTNVGLIELSIPNSAFQVETLGHPNGFYLKKVMVKNASPEIMRSHYPDAEIVQDKRSIMEDSSIDLIVISGAPKTDLDLVAEVLQTGKHVRIV